ncbi:hypothetical protein HPP92_005331 [Vanilla planifolia]|uniref:Uncharacterized protein n=1 Tax=Vanilla planifolia TaxID=51239 RepID=A0A835RYE5_VANPL|nr:hypothetical protein HPP92_005649 [Vanilla planifolia]KAG0494337.1 hypothetical protein HPP92_005331 [Vanilla planifolia]
MKADNKQKFDEQMDKVHNAIIKESAKEGEQSKLMIEDLRATIEGALTRFRPFGQKTFGVRFSINMAKAEALDLFSEDALLMKERT